MKSNGTTSSTTDVTIDIDKHSDQIKSLSSLNQEAIRLENVGVRYRVSSERISSIKEYAIQYIQGKIKLKNFWALSNVHLTINPGEALVARVLRPTVGRVLVQGHVAPLLELGAGFHPELTGRENIYLNGALLGFTRKEMDFKFKQIVDFSELWDFIDSPMRTYSSGMWARLGFAVATDVNPDILIIDEILSVGDESFQRKSALRMQEFRDSGATILLVSHDMEIVEQMCHRVAWLDRGKILALGSPGEVIKAYRQSQTF